jgi:hypothetical protein
MKKINICILKGRTLCILASTMPALANASKRSYKQKTFKKKGAKTSGNSLVALSSSLMEPETVARGE